MVNIKSGIRRHNHKRGIEKINVHIAIEKQQQASWRIINASISSASEKHAGVISSISTREKYQSRRKIKKSGRHENIEGRGGGGRQREEVQKKRRKKASYHKEKLNSHVTNIALKASEEMSKRNVM